MPESLGDWGGGHSRMNFNTVIPKFEEIFSLENLWRAWRAFSAGKKQKADVAEFASYLFRNLSDLQAEILAGSYRHGQYQHFRVQDQKVREIHKAPVRDRVVHHALYQALYPYFDKKFIHDSYSCRLKKGTHRALRRFASLARREGLNHTHTVWVLKCDVSKCFASIDHAVLKAILERHISCQRTLQMLNLVIDSFGVGSGCGIPLGNLTSQLFVNIYLNELDQYAKRILGTRSYLRYADDWVVFSRERAQLENLLGIFKLFTGWALKFKIKPEWRSIRTVASGVDWLGWVHFPDHRVLRTSTKQKLLMNFKTSPAVRTSYLGLLTHGNARKLATIVSGEPRAIIGLWNL